ncbi:hypothetical protein MXL46_11690 [Heyndrickxia sporothermodurans]|uniref:hypothetical protein n=1 Tax=Heyndrickxia sporothermodurans TaxID=46224 RepID=UPI002DB9A34F|nr:hypothetical protein [Heyndrickxia sporothermodurans]MEB6549748.1 hypothetical protein [Heyndrickxia sporothermodurans]
MRTVVSYQSIHKDKIKNKESRLFEGLYPQLAVLFVLIALVAFIALRLFRWGLTHIFSWFGIGG